MNELLWLFTTETLREMAKDAARMMLCDEKERRIVACKVYAAVIAELGQKYKK